MKENEKTNVSELAKYLADQVIQKMNEAEQDYDNDINNIYTSIYGELYDLTEGFECSGGYNGYLIDEVYPKVENAYYKRIKELSDSFMGRRRVHSKKEATYSAKVDVKVRPCFNFLEYPVEIAADFFTIFVNTLAGKEIKEELDGEEIANVMDEAKKEDMLIRKLYPPTGDRRIKKFFDDNIHLGKNYSFIYDFLRSCNIQFENLERIKYGIDINSCGAEKSNQDIMFDTLEEFEGYSGFYYGFLRNCIRNEAILYLIGITKKMKRTDKQYITKYAIKLHFNMRKLYNLDAFIDKLKENHCAWRRLKCINEFERYCVLWNLSIWELVEGLQQNLLHNEKYKKEEWIIKFEKRMHLLLKEKEQIRANISCNKSRDIYKAYYVYNCMQLVYNKFILEQQVWDDYTKKQSLTKTQYCQPENNDKKIDCEVFTDQISSNDKLKRMYTDFNEGITPCTEKTFKDRLKKCNNFIKTYGGATRKIWNQVYDSNVLRTVYRMLYVDGFNFERRSASTWAKELIDLLYGYRSPFEEEKEKRIKSSGKIKEAHVWLGSGISRALMDEVYKTKDINFIKYRAWTVINKVALSIFLTYCPGIDGENNYDESFIETRKVFDSIFLLIYGRED